MGETKKIGDLAVQASLDVAKLKAQGVDGVKSIEALVAAAAKLDKGLSKSESSIKRTADRLTSLGTAAAQQKMNELAAGVERAGAAFTRTGAQADFLRGKIDRLTAAGAKLPASLANLKLDNGGFEKVFSQQAVQQAQALTSRLGPLGGVLGALGPAGIAAGAGIAASALAMVALGDAVKTATNWASKITDTADALNYSTEGVQRLQFAVRKSGVDFDLTTSAIDHMQRQLVSAPEKFEALGLNVAELRRSKPEEVFIQVAGAVAAVDDKFQQGAIGADIFGVKFSKIAPLVKGGMDAFKDAVVVSDELIQELNQTKTATNVLSSEWDRLWVAIGAAVVGGKDAPEVITNIASAVAALGTTIQKFGPYLAMLSPLGGMAAGAGAKKKFLEMFGSPEMPDLKVKPKATAVPGLPGIANAEDAAKLEQANRRHMEALHEQERAAKELVQLGQKYSGAAAQSDLDKLTTAYLRNRQAIEASAPGLKRLLNDAKELAGQGGVLSPALVTAIVESTRKRPKAELERFGIKAFSSTLEESLAPGRADKVRLDAEQAQKDARAKAQGWADFFAAPAAAQKQILDSMAGIDEKTKDVEKSTDTWHARLEDIAHLVDLIGGKGLGAVLGGIAGAGAGIDALKVKGGGGGFSLTGGKSGKDGISALLGNVFAGAQIASAAVGIAKGLASALTKSEPEKIMEDVGKRWGTKISDGTAKAIEETEKSKKVSRQLAELLNLDKIMAESDADPAKFADKIGDLMNAEALGLVSTKDATEQLGKAFGDLKTAAEGGSTASEAAMVGMVRRARQLKLEIPEISAALKGWAEDARANLKDFFAGQNGGKAGSSGQGAANQAIFSAVMGLDAATEGLVALAIDGKDAFDALVKTLPEGTALSGLAAHFGLIEHALDNPLFKGAAQSATAGGKIFGDLYKSDALSQTTTDAFSTTLKSGLDQAFEGTDASLSETDRRKLAEEANLPLLTQMQHAEAAGVQLSAETKAELEQARKDGLLPMKSIAEQSLGVLRQIRDGQTGEAGGGSFGGGGGQFMPGQYVPPASSTSFPNHDFGSPAIPSGDLALRGAPGVTAESSKGRPGGASVSFAPSIQVTVNVPQALDPAAVADAVATAMDRSVSPKLKTQLDDHMRGRGVI